MRQRRPDVRIKRIYDEALPSDGFRVLVDRLWPRGITRKKAALDAWLREVAPSPALRKWFGHDPGHWAEFRKRYRAELRGQAVQLAQLRHDATERPLTLLYAAHDPRINHAAVLKQAIEKSAARPRPARKQTLKGHSR